MNTPLFLGTAFVISSMILIWIFRQAAKEVPSKKQKLTREQKAMKRMGARI